MFCGAGLGPPIVSGAAAWRAAALVLGALATTLESGWARADTHLVLPNGLPTRVVPTYPEPGLPTFAYPQQNLIDTGGVTGATAATGTGASDLTFGGTGSGVDLRRARFMEPSVYHELAMGATERLGATERPGGAVVGRQRSRRAASMSPIA